MSASEHLKIQPEVFMKEAARLVEAANDKGVVLRVMGATAYRIHSKEQCNLHDALGRRISDLDFAAYSKQRKEVMKVLEEGGYLQDDRTAMIAAVYMDRFIFKNPKNNLVADVFFDKLVMCHTIDFKGRLEVDFPTIPLAELLLEKMQIVRIEDKDFKDAIILFMGHDVGKGDKETINSDYIADILSKDWGFYYTVSTNLNKFKDSLPKYSILKESDQKDIRAKIDKLLEAIESKPKSLSWKLRAKVGTSKKWYRDVEEVYGIEEIYKSDSTN
jgi:hypothetical protein